MFLVLFVPSHSFVNITEFKEFLWYYHSLGQSVIFWVSIMCKDSSAKRCKLDHHKYVSPPFPTFNPLLERNTLHLTVCVCCKWDFYTDEPESGACRKIFAFICGVWDAVINSASTVFIFNSIIIDGISKWECPERQPLVRRIIMVQFSWSKIIQPISFPVSLSCIDHLRTGLWMLHSLSKQMRLLTWQFLTCQLILKA